jgi:cellulose synthase operon protein B
LVALELVMMSNVARRCRALAAGLLLAAMAWPGASTAQTALRSQPHFEGQTIAVLLAERGWPEGMQLHGHFDRQILHLPTLSALGPTRGSLRLAFDSRLPGYRFASLQIRINDRAAEAIDLLARPGGALELALSGADLARPFTKIEAILRGSIADDRCVDERIAGGFVSLLPSSGLHLAPSPELGPDVWRTLVALPRRVEIGFAGNPSEPALFAAALTTAAALARSGHEPIFRDTDTAGVGIAAGEGLYDLVRLEAESRPPDVIIGEPALIQRAMAAIGAERGGPVIAADFRAGGEERLAALPLGSRTVLAVTPAAATGLATLLSRGLTPLAAGPGTAIETTLSASTPTPAVLRLADLAADLGPRALLDEAEWRLAIPVTRLPAGHVARHAVLDVAIPPSIDAPSGDETVLARAVVNGELVGAWRLQPGPEPVRLRLPLDRAGTRLVSDLRLVLQRQPGSHACRTQPVPVEVELVPTSHVELARLSGPPATFAEFAAGLGETVEIQIDPAHLSQPATLLTTLTPVIEQLVRGGARLRVETGSATATASGAILVGRRFADALTAPMALTGQGVTVAGLDGTRLAEVTPDSSLAVLQLARRGGEPVLWLAGSTAELPIWRPARLDRENVVIGDAIGTRIGFDVAADRAITVDHRAAASWSDRLGGVRAALLAALWLGLTITAILIARRRARRRAAPAV